MEKELPDSYALDRRSTSCRAHLIVLNQGLVKAVSRYKSSWEIVATVIVHFGIVTVPTPMQIQITIL